MRADIVPGVLEGLLCLFRQPSATPRVVIRTPLEGRAVQQTVLVPFALIEDPQFHQLPYDPQELLPRTEQEPGEYPKLNNGNVGPVQDLGRKSCSLFAKEYVYVSLIGFRRHAGDLEVECVRMVTDLFEQSPVDTPPFGAKRS